MTELVKYDALMHALAEVKNTDELLSIRDRADALQHAARIAGNKTAEVDMAEIRFRAERYLGEMIQKGKQTGELSSGGRPRKTSPNSGGFSPAALKDAGIDPHTAQRAQQLAAVPAETFDGMVSTYRDRVLKEGERVTRHLIKAGVKAQGRADRELQLADRIAAENARLGAMERKYGAIIADCPWQFESYSELTGMDRAPDNHYPTMPTDEICELFATKLPAYKVAVLGLWAWAPMLPDALRVMEAAGFEYKSQMVWVKIYPGEQRGLGYWFRMQHELLLIGTRGGPPAPEMGTQWPSVQRAPVIVDAQGRIVHSAKPPLAHGFMEKFYPNTPKLEMFSRSDREGWDAWGAEAPTDGQSSAG